MIALNAERLEFREISKRWAREPETYPWALRGLGRSDEARLEAIALEELTAAIWRGEFEAAGEDSLTFPVSVGIQKVHDGWMELTVIGHYLPESMKVEPSTGRMMLCRSQITAPTGLPPQSAMTREDLREGLRQSDWCSADDASADDEDLANLPIEFYSPEFREHVLERISLSKAACRKWCADRGCALPMFWFGAQAKAQPRKADLPAAPEPKKSTRGRKLGSSRFEAKDKKIIKLMQRALENGEADSVPDAAQLFAEQAEGGGSVDSRAKRLERKFCRDLAE